WFIYLPKTQNKWDILLEEFENICGFLHACLAIDGSLFCIEQPVQYDGWYCRKGYLVLNAQIVVDSSLYIHSFNMRPGLLKRVACLL
ncbi:putative nuclease harbi1, partial [Nowakowskiella sp. JEL0078]